MAEPGAVGWQFSRRGVVLVGKNNTEDEVMMVSLDHGAEDIVDDGEHWRVLCDPHTLFDLKASLEQAGMTVVSAESTMVSSMTVAVAENDDVQDVYSNFDISDEILNEVAS
jgi:transcriptional/translational regulatory protein YebC/TACO1